MAPTWSPKWSQNREKIEAKIDQNFDGSWGRIFEGFWWIWEGKMEPSWDQNRTKNPCEHRDAILRKSCSHSCGGVNFLDSGVQVGSKNRSKIDQKLRSRWEGILASIFHGFWWILKAKLVPCWGRKSIKIRSKKALKCFECIWNGFKRFSEGFKKFLEDSRRVPGGGSFAGRGIQAP